jgi:hypothetical protein
MSLPSPIITVLAHFQPLFTAPTWKKVVTLLVGTLLARGRRTVAAADGTADGHALQWVSSGAQSCALVAAWSEQETITGARADLCACRSHGRDRLR